MDDTTPLLLIVALIVLPFGWLAYRGERDRHHRHLLELMRRQSCEADAMLSAMAGARHQLEAAARGLIDAARVNHCAIHQAAEATRRKQPEPTPDRQPARKRQRKG